MTSQSTASRPSVCFVCLSAYGYFNPDEVITGGGAERQFHLLGTSLTDTFDVHFVVGDYGQTQREVRDGVTLHRSYVQSPNSTITSRIRQVRRLFGAMRRSNADVFVYRGFPHKAAIVGLIAQVLGTPWLYHVSSDDNVDAHQRALSTPFSALFEYELGRARAVVAQTDYQRRRLQESFGVEAIQIPNGYPKASPHRPHTDREGVIWVGNVHESNKRPHLFLNLAEKIPDERFLLIGPDDGDPAYCRKIRERARAIENAEYVGEIPPDEVHAYFETAKLLANTSPVEGFPNTFLEAWRYGTPVVGLDVNPSKFVDVPDRPGFSDGDFEKFVDDVRRLATDPSAREVLGEAARESFEERYGLSEVVAQYRRLLSNAVEDR